MNRVIIIVIHPSSRVYIIKYTSNINMVSWHIVCLQIVKMLLNTDCKCHGVSGSCTMKTCWHSLPHFREVGKALMRKYRKARSVQAAGAVVAVGGGNPQRASGKRSSRRLRLRLRSARSAAAGSVDEEEPKITELVYLEQSPNYCDRDFGTGSLGTYGRSCNRTSEGEFRIIHKKSFISVFFFLLLFAKMIKHRVWPYIITCTQSDFF